MITSWCVQSGNLYVLSNASNQWHKQWTRYYWRGRCEYKYSIGSTLVPERLWAILMYLCQSGRRSDYILHLARNHVRAVNSLKWANQQRSVKMDCNLLSPSTVQSLVVSVLDHADIYLHFKHNWQLSWFLGGIWICIMVVWWFNHELIQVICSLLSL